MRIAFVTDTYPPERSSAALASMRTVQGLRAAGHAVQLIRPRQQGEAPRRDAQEWRSASAPLPVARALRFGWATPAALRSLWLGDGLLPDLVHIATPGPLGWSALRAARGLGLATSADLCTALPAWCGQHGLGWLEPAVLAYLRRLHAMADASFVPTPELCAQWMRQGFERIQVLGQGVDALRFSPARRDARLRRDWRAGPQHRVLLHVGRLAPQDNVPLALQTFERLSARRPGLRMVVVGDGPLLEPLARAHPRVLFVGTKAGLELARHVASADVGLFPSLTGSPGPATLQALASGLAVVAFDTGVAGQPVCDGISGCLAPPCDGLDAADAFLDAASRALDASAPGHPLRHQARLAALQADWSRVQHCFEQHLVALALPGAPARLAALA